MKSFLSRTRTHLDEIDRKWGSVIQVILGTAIVCVCLFLVILAVEIRSQGEKTDRRAAETQEQSKISCIRTRQFGPSLAARYAENHWLTPDQLKAYLDTIPTKC